ncbi:MAG: hypothetical protein WCD63_12675, partial [Terrimicrobiaceae bacterium]
KKVNANRESRAIIFQGNCPRAREPLLASLVLEKLKTYVPVELNCWPLSIFLQHTLLLPML